MDHILFTINDAKLDHITLNKIKQIALYTKTGDKEKPVNHIISQPVLLYYLTKKYNVKNFFEIGTGRGTTSLSVSLIPTVH